MNKIVKAEPHLPDESADSFVQFIERAVRDPSIDVDKIDRLLQMRERENARLAVQSFNAAMAAAQTELQPIGADSNNPQTRSRYASYTALDRIVRPIYTRHGFGLSFTTEESPGPDTVRVVCDVYHREGHTRRYQIDMPADGKGARGGDVMTKTHAMGSGVSYGRRYLLTMIFNLIIDRDDDGNAASRRRPAAPAANPMRTAGVEPPAAPASSQASPEHTESDAGNPSAEELMLYDDKLEKAAQMGMTMLKLAWDEIPASIRPFLKAALERRHKPTAAGMGA